MEVLKSYDCAIDKLMATELRLGLPGIEGPSEVQTRGTKRSNEQSDDQEIATATKAQVVGWPPLRLPRKNCSSRAKAKIEGDNIGGLYVKVSMDGAPYLRKIDLSTYQGYNEFRGGLKNLFNCFSFDYAATYEDKEGDWMLVGDVPWG
ncbi:uncharacterized protein A4U43_C07F25760 [Asparagus officinalis]|uniref:Auxin-responsive protein n=2 Tax=Asparagus officinalis TaxID=4686 RepID=A0A5P1EEU9_ASPOF|nr:uncharacterized protein A4U43_C07F25760 [Asparagus officinalis]